MSLSGYCYFRAFYTRQFITSTFTLYYTLKIDLDSEGLCYWLNDLLEEGFGQAQGGRHELQPSVVADLDILCQP